MPKIPDETKYTATLAVAEAFQHSAKEGNGKYVHVPLAAVDAELSVMTTEYVTPRGETGYQIISFADSGTTFRSKATGPEVDSRTWDWRKRLPDI